MTEETRTIVDRVRRTVKPETVIAVQPDGTRVPLGIGHLKTRWKRLADLLDSMEWAELECYDATGARIATIPADDDVDAAARTTDDPMASQLTVWTAHTDRMVAHVRGSSKDVLDALIVALQNQVTRNAELNAENATLQETLSQVYGQLRELLLQTTDHAPSPKEDALIGLLDAAGQKYLGLPPMRANSKPPPNPPGNGGTT